MCESVAFYLYDVFLIDNVLDVCYHDYDDIVARETLKVNNKFNMEEQTLRPYRNEEVRRLAKERDVKLWEIAEKLGYADATLSRKLRHELPSEERKTIFAIIEELSQEQQEVGGNG